MSKPRNGSFLLFASDGQGPDDGCDHGDYSEESDADSPDTDSGSDHGDGE